MHDPETVALGRIHVGDSQRRSRLPVKTMNHGWPWVSGHLPHAAQKVGPPKTLSAVGLLRQKLDRIVPFC